MVGSTLKVGCCVLYWLINRFISFNIVCLLVWILYLLRKMNDVEIERQYGRNRNKHIATEYATHLEVNPIQRRNSF